MAGDVWITKRLGEVANINPDAIGRDWPHPHIRYIDISSVGMGEISLAPQWMKLSDAPSRAKRLVCKGDTVLSTVRPNRRSMFFASQPGNDWVVSTGFAVLRPNIQLVDPRFLYACVFNQSFTEYLITREKGAAYPAVSPEDIANAEIPFPPLKEQQAIACILGALDDKIELNRQMNRTLEEMARAIFKSWFVDFDPVRAKAAGHQPPGLKPEIAALFPDSLEDSEVGEIPKGCEARTLYDAATFINGAAFKSEDFCAPGEGLPVIKIAELKDGISPQTKWSKRQADPGQIIDTGDLLYSWSGSPDTSLDAFLWTKGAGLLNQHIFKVVTPTIAQKRFAYYLFKHLRPVLVETARNKQTTGLGHVTIADMKRLKICWPRKDALEAFDSRTGTIFDRAFACTIENQILAALRDALLPKLISGELPVPDAERIAGRCV